MDYLKLGFEL